MRLLTSLASTARRRIYFPRSGTASPPSDGEPTSCSSHASCENSGGNEGSLSCSLHLPAESLRLRRPRAAAHAGPLESAVQKDQGNLKVPPPHLRMRVGGWRRTLRVLQRVTFIRGLHQGCVLVPLSTGRNLVCRYTESFHLAVKTPRPLQT